MKIIVGLTGGSASIYALSILAALKKVGVETHFVASHMGEVVLKQELNMNLQDLSFLCDYMYDIGDLGARIASGSFKVNGMIIAPCSMRTVAAISNGMSDNLITRAADVILKEKKKLTLVVRETPFNTIHLKNMLELSELGTTIFPPIPSFYTKPESLEDSIVNTTGRILDVMGIENSLVRRWDGL
ncbi:UbiX family flavin prenyltransferase [Microaceticoccus formicicus]|uniref:UbiX family flavin prenyltransferase n=1 Tax=Microaceticoccus formicicus TaxID=3118105 RepID=UPI003CCFF9D3|nr:UbiX family flavin prenyltransferase [Peptoniphilaceae bacterium AMB_02]